MYVVFGRGVYLGASHFPFYVADYTFDSWDGKIS